MVAAGMTGGVATGAGCGGNAAAAALSAAACLLAFTAAAAALRWMTGAWLLVPSVLNLACVRQLCLQHAGLHHLH